jgi:hypothetical protein
MPRGSHGLAVMSPEAVGGLEGSRRAVNKDGCADVRQQTARPRLFDLSPRRGRGDSIMRPATVGRLAGPPAMKVRLVEPSASRAASHSPENAAHLLQCGGQ